jgi:phosphoglucosamine mutase
VHEVRADVGVALDGDADRVILIDERGQQVDGDQILALCATDMAESKRLRGGGVVATVMSNLGLEKALQSAGLGLERTQVGDRYVVEAMRKGGYNLGGEQSGHVIFLDHTTTGDGLMTALQVLAIMARKGVPLSMLAAGFKRYPQVMENVSVLQKKPLEELSVLQDAIAEVETKLGGKGRVLIRYSGTELKARVMVEGQNEVEVREHVAHLIDVLEQELAR